MDLKDIPEDNKNQPVFHLGQEALGAYQADSSSENKDKNATEKNANPRKAKPVAHHNASPKETINRPLVESYPDVADDNDEELLADVRRHWFGKVSIIVTGSLVTILLIVFAVVIPSIVSSTSVGVSKQLAIILSVILIMVALLVVVGSYVALWVYKQSRMLITDQNVIELRQMSLFSHKVSHLNMINVEDVTVTKRGILQSIFDYGNLQIETAGEKDNFNFSNTPDPDTYRRIVINAHERAIERVGTMGSGQRVQIINNAL